MSRPRLIGQTRQHGSGSRQRIPPKQWTPEAGRGSGTPHVRDDMKPGEGHFAIEPPADHVLLVTENGRHSVYANLGEDGATMADDSYGGWEAIAVPGQRARPVWRGVGAPTLTLALLLNGWPRQSVEAECEALEAMAGLTPGFEESEPPKLRIYGGAVPHSHFRNPHYRWVVSGLSWTDPVIRLRSGGHATVAMMGHRPQPAHRGARVRQGVALTLMLADDPVSVDRLRPRKPRPHARHIRARKGDTYAKIAKRELGTARLGHKLAVYNGERDPSKKLKAGTKVKIPAHEIVRRWKDELQRRRSGLGNPMTRDLG